MTERAHPRRTPPMRTCIGCRVTSAKSDLLRVVAAGTVLVPDPRGRLPGRGAHLHPTPDCLALAERRRAFGRALRLSTPVDLAPVREWVSKQTGPRRADDHDERSMSQHR